MNVTWQLRWSASTKTQGGGGGLGWKAENWAPVSVSQRQPSPQHHLLPFGGAKELTSWKQHGRVLCAMKSSQVSAVLIVNTRINTVFWEVIWILAELVFINSQTTNNLGGFKYRRGTKQPPLIPGAAASRIQSNRIFWNLLVKALIQETLKVIIYK